MPLLTPRSLIVALLTAGAMACHASPTQRSPRVDEDKAAVKPPAKTLAAAGTGHASSACDVEPPPRGRWRLVDPNTLSSVLVWASHILIRHDDSQQSASFSRVPFRTALEPVHRTRAEARCLAAGIAERLRRSPEDFARVARELSDDPITRPSGGMLGGLSGSYFFAWSEVLDAWAATSPGEVTLPVETPYGFHVFLIHPPPEEVRVSGAHIVIGHSDAPWLRWSARGDLPTRSRQEALALAEGLQHQLVSHPERFAALAEQYSDHESGDSAGDFGSWSNRELSGSPRVIDALSRLSEGAITAPIETAFGFQLVQRTTDRPRRRAAYARIDLRYDPGPEADPSVSLAAVSARAHDMAAALAKDPLARDALQGDLCCAGSFAWVEGRDSPALGDALGRLRPDHFSDQPVQLSNLQRFVIVQRLRDAQMPAAELLPTTQLPAPAAPQLDYFIGQSGAWVEATLFKVAQQARQRLPSARNAAFDRAHTVAGKFRSSQLQERASAFDSLIRDVEHSLAPEDLAPYRYLLQQEIEQSLLDLVPHTLSASRAAPQAI